MESENNNPKTKVAYSGVEGAFAHIVAKKTFPKDLLIAHTSFEEAYNAVLSGECSSAVLPIENSYTGEVGQVIDLMVNGELIVDDVIPYKISQNLLGIKGAKTSDIKKVISHSQALAQCEGYIRKHGFEEMLAPNTAMAAKEVSELGDIHMAAIASKETAELYGLDILHANINEMEDNTTRFAVFSKNYKKHMEVGKHINFILIFTVNNVAGALSKAISVISDYGFNMKVLRSRPSHQKAWEYYFYVEAEGNIDTPEGKEMQKRLTEVCNLVKIAGKYT
ncbi:MAG: bifunctional chorismate mutase/prephenate dehydratase [Lachnospiraceae bacterium]|nr:bifunctional chorismate mutase/prephenate dehydratase [Lachnospiraceae bacterium]